MELNKFIRDRKNVRFKITMNADSDDVDVDGEERSIIAHEKPLPALDKSLSALRIYFAVSLEIPEPETYAETVQVYGIAITRTKAGTRSIILLAKKELSTRRSSLLKMQSPLLQIDKAQEGESGEIEIEPKYLKLVVKLIAEAEKYAQGERAQGRLDLDDDSAALNALADKGEEDGPSLFS